MLEAVEAARFERANTRHDERIARRWERQPVDDHARERIADDVDALPEGSGCEEHRTGRAPKPFEEVRAGKLALKSYRKGEPFGDERIYFSQARVRREEHEGTSAGSVEALFEIGAARRANSDDFGLIAAGATKSRAWRA